jgi:hypothetical protein
VSKIEKPMGRQRPGDEMKSFLEKGKEGEN